MKAGDAMGGTEATLRRLIADSLQASGRDPVTRFADDDFLPQILDSVVLSSLLVRIEEEWDLEISDDEIEPELFENITSLARFVRSKLS